MSFIHQHMQAQKEEKELLMHCMTKKMILAWQI